MNVLGDRDSLHACGNQLKDHPVGSTMDELSCFWHLSVFFTVQSERNCLNQSSSFGVAQRNVVQRRNLRRLCLHNSMLGRDHAQSSMR